MTVQAARNPLKLVQGSLDALYDAQTKVLVCLDVSKAVVNSKSAQEWIESTGEDNVREWPNVLRECVTTFCAHYDEKIQKKSAQSVTTLLSEAATHTLTINVSHIDLGGMAKVWGLSSRSGGAKISGTMVLTDKEGNTVALLEFTNLQGMIAPKIFQRIVQAHRSAAIFLVDLLK